MSEPFWRALRARHPPLREALVADARITARLPRRAARVPLARRRRGADAAPGMGQRRVPRRRRSIASRRALQARGVPLLPRLAHRLAMAVAQVSIGDPVVVRPGVYLVHGQVVIDGLVEIHAGVTIAPFVTIGLRAGDVRGATIERDVSIGTGAKVIGPVPDRRRRHDRRERGRRRRRPAGRHRGRRARPPGRSVPWRACGGSGARHGRRDRRRRSPATSTAATRSCAREIERLSARATARRRDRETERRLLRLRHLAGMRAAGRRRRRPEHPAPDAERAARRPTALPEIAAADAHARAAARRHPARRLPARPRAGRRATRRSRSPT